ncbi:MAG: hypothetical protein WD317_10745 [Balneolaceae bacterium]
MKFIPLIVLLSLLTSVSLAQNIEIIPAGNSSENDVRTFSFDQSSLRIQGNSLIVSGSGNQVHLDRSHSYDISGRGSFLGVIHFAADLRTTVIDGRGQSVGNTELTYFDPDDETLMIRMLNDGSFVTRDNVANFSFFDSDGTLSYQVSNSSGSLGGEALSEMAADPSGKTILLYNPRINFDEGQGSRARIIMAEDETIDVFYSRSRTLKYADVTENGSFLILITEQEGREDEVLILDRFGNEIAAMTTGEELVGATLSEDARNLTIFSSNRVQVYRVTDMERLGSSSFRTRINYAVYNERDQQILALSGQIDGNNRISNPEFHAVHLGKRSIARTEVGFPISFLDDSRIEVKRTGTNRFTVDGLNRVLSIQTYF